MRNGLAFLHKVRKRPVWYGWLDQRTKHDAVETILEAHTRRQRVSALVAVLVGNNLEILAGIVLQQP
jgi:hypothetical protein